MADQNDILRQASLLVKTIGEMGNAAPEAAKRLAELTKDTIKSLVPENHGGSGPKQASSAGSWAQAVTPQPDADGQDKSTGARRY